MRSLPCHTGNIRRAEHFVSFLKRFVAYLFDRMKVPNVVTESPTTFTMRVQETVRVDAKTLRWAVAMACGAGACIWYTCWMRCSDSHVALV